MSWRSEASVASVLAALISTLTCGWPLKFLAHVTEGVELPLATAVTWARRSAAIFGMLAVCAIAKSPPTANAIQVSVGRVRSVMNDLPVVAEKIRAVGRRDPGAAGAANLSLRSTFRQVNSRHSGNERCIAQL
jgi:hypothetical protein